jgi:hypothetical protein
MRAEDGQIGNGEPAEAAFWFYRGHGANLSHFGKDG